MFWNKKKEVKIENISIQPLTSNEFEQLMNKFISLRGDIGILQKDIESLKAQFQSFRTRFSRYIGNIEETEEKTGGLEFPFGR